MTTLAIGGVDVGVFVAGSIGLGIFVHMLLDAIRGVFDMLYDIARNVL